MPDQTDPENHCHSAENRACGRARNMLGTSANRARTTRPKDHIYNNQSVTGKNQWPITKT